MLFPTITFAVFFAAVLPASWALMPRPRLWKPFMLAASYVFYGSWDHRFALLLGASTVANHLFAKRIERTAVSRPWLIAAVAVNLGVLAAFKYLGFFTSSLANLIGGSVPVLELMLPVGISFFTFQALSYVIDVHRGTLRSASLLDVALYLSFFPHLVAGPIVRGSEFLPQLERPRDPDRVEAPRAFELILRGVFKKAVVASFLGAALVDPVFDAPGAHTAPEILLATYGYAVQVYADFSGYTDMAIGIALLLGFRFPQNFDNPYAAVSLRDFWTRWHMTLSRWLRDYLYVPLGGSRGTRGATYRNLFLTMLLGGLWHGAAWTFVAWGALHGAALVAERALGATDIDVYGRRQLVVRRIVTFHVVCLGWVFFRSGSFGDAATLLWRLLTAWGAAPLVTPLAVLVVGGAIAAQQSRTDWFARLRSSFDALAPAAQAGVLATAMLIVSMLKPDGVAPFIYFRF